MTTFKCEVEIDWLDEEDTIDDKIQREIAKNIVSQIKEKEFAPIINVATDTLKEKTDVLVQDTLNKFMAKKIVITDKWGNIEEEYGNVDELLQDKFDNYILEPVDSSGEAHSKRGCLVGGKARIIYKIEELVKEKCDRYAKTILNDVDSIITNRLDKSLREKVTNTLVKKIDLTSVIDS